MFLRRLFALFALLLAFHAHAMRIAPRSPIIVAPDARTPIELQQLSIRAEISGGMAETTVRMVFFNPNPRQLEGTLQFPLFDGQSITAFALDVGGKLRAAVPVEKAKGRAVFEEIARRRVDPALLEQTQGNNFKIRIYPIPANGTRTVELTYAQTLARIGKEWQFKLPLSYGATREMALSVAVNGDAPPSANDLRFERSATGFEARLTASDWQGGDALDIRTAASDTPQVYQQTVKGTSYFLAEIPVASTSTLRAPPRTIGLLWDSSGSGANRETAAELGELDRYFKAIGNVEVRLIRLRDRAEAPIVFRVRGGDWALLRQALEGTVYDGATALNDWKLQSDVDHYLLFSDGLSNYGGNQFPALASHQRLFALNSSASADTARLCALAAQNRGACIDVDAQRPGEAARQLRRQDATLDRMQATGASDLVAESTMVKDGMLRVAGRLSPNGPHSLNLSVGNETVSVDLDGPLTAHPMAAGLWAAYKLRALEADPEAHRAEIGRIGRQFGIASRDTSLIVLETAEDYARYEIAPPEELRAAYNKIASSRAGALALKRRQHAEQVLAQFNERIVWWNTRFPKNDIKRMPSPPEAPPLMAMAAPPAPVIAMAPVARSVEILDRRVASPKMEPAAGAAPQIGIALRKWESNAPYVARLKSARREQVYAWYLDEKPAYANSSAFYLDVADILIDKGERDLALRVLSNLAEMDLENRAVLRILGYRLLQAGAPRLAIPIFQKVLQLAQEEPQSYRDLGLAYAQAGQRQEAIDQLLEVVQRPWDARFPDIEIVALAELNAIVATAPKKLDTRRIDPRLLQNLPLDLRVVLTWDADNSDMDLWVTDPNGERAFFGNPLTAQGGHMSRDFTGGYGPEEFALREAKRGKYRIEANYYGNQQQVIAGATTLQVKLFTGFGTPRQKEQVVTLRLKDRGESVYVGEFEVSP